MNTASAAGLHKAEASLKRIVRNAIASHIPHSLLRKVAARNFPIAILMYHTLGPDDDDFDAWTVVRVADFKQQMAFVRRHYDIVSLDEALEGRERSGRPRAVVTFDDGDVGLYRHLLPIVEELALPVTIYVATGAVETGQQYWFDRLMNGLQSATPLAFDLSLPGLPKGMIGSERGERNWLAIGALLDHLKTVEPNVRESACRELLAKAATLQQIPHVALGPMTVDQVREISRNPLITLGSHTHCHSLLDQLRLDDAVASVDQSCRLLEQWTGRAPRHFAYPNGNHSPALQRAVASMGFRSATIADGGAWSGRGSLTALPRIPVGRYDDLGRFALRLAGLLK